MNDSAPPPTNRARFGLVQSLTLILVATGIIWLIGAQYKLSNELSTAKADGVSLVQEVQALRALSEKQAIALPKEVDAAAHDKVMLGQELQSLRALTVSQANALSKEVAAAKADSETLVRELQALRTLTEKQAIALHRAIGASIPVTVPPELESVLPELEARIQNQPRWPQNADEARAYLNQTSSLVRALPAWAEADYLPRLSPVRWSALAFVELTAPTESDSLPSVIDKMDNLIDNAPEGFSVALMQKLIDQSKRLSSQLDQMRLTEAVKVARLFVENPHGPSEDKMIDVTNSYDLLGQPQNDASQDTAFATLRSKLKQAMLQRQAKQRAAGLNARWSAMQPLREEQPVLFEMSLGSLLGEVSATRVNLALEGVKQPNLEELHTTLRTTFADLMNRTGQREEERRSRALRKYQAWALKQVKKAESQMKHDWLGKKAWEAISRIKDGRNIQEFEGLPSVQDAILNAQYKWVENTVFPGGKHFHTWHDHAYEESEFASTLWFLCLRDVLVTELLPVDTQQLEPAVLDRYNRVWSQGWKVLEGRDDQTFVAERTALTRKKSVRDFLESEK